MAGKSSDVLRRQACVLEALANESSILRPTTSVASTGGRERHRFLAGEHDADGTYALNRKNSTSPSRTT